MCNRFPASRCVCGAQRCARHMDPPTPQHKVLWKQSESSPAPFYVQNPTLMRKDHQIEWIREQLPDEASLPEFAEKYLELFSEINCEEIRRKNCLDLYRLFNSSFKVKKECELPPAELYQFQLVFDPAAFPRCNWCSKELKDGQRSYCDSNCVVAAHPPGTCRKCGSTKQEVVHMAFEHGPKNGLVRCLNCKDTQYCELVAAPRNKRGSSTAPPHWSKRRKS